MTQVFDPESGNAIPVTVVQAGPCIVTQIKTKETDGYSSIQVGYGEVKEKALSKPELGHLNKAGATPVRHLKEYRLEDTGNYELGKALDLAEIFNTETTVDVSGKTMGRGFAGYHKRHNFHRGLMSHGSKSHRAPGSTPGRTYPGKKMAGRYGGKQVTTRKLKVVRVDAEQNLLLIKGAIPGKPGSLLSISPSKIVG
jgi:large subunit ribosomal protein L3